MWLTCKKITCRPVLSVLLLVVVIYFGATFVVMAYEKVGFGDATAEILPAFFGEVGIVESPFLPVRVSIVAGLVASVTFLANMEERPIKDERIEFIKGDPTQDGDLVRAGVMTADSVIVLTDLDKGPNEADAEALMVVLAVESLNRKVHTCVQLLNSANRMHLERAHADEIICLDQLGGNLVVASALNHGISHIVTELLTFDIGSEFYRYDGHISEALEGREFAEAVQVLAQQRMILLAVETDYSEEVRAQLSADILYELPEENRVMVVNPQSRYKIRQGDALFVISESEPAEL